MIGRTKSWLAWLAGAILAMVFGGAGCGEGNMPQPAYGARTTPPAPPARQPAPAKPATSLEESPDWKVVTDACDFAMPFARSGKSTGTQRKAAEARLSAAREAIARLAQAGLLAPAEAELLAAEVLIVMADVRQNPPEPEPGQVTAVLCYDMAVIVPAQRSTRRLADRLPLLRKLADDGKVHRTALEKVLAAVEADLAVLADEKELARLHAIMLRPDAEKTRDAVQAEVEKLKKLLSDGK